jgi:hypothetical protein
MEEVLKRVYTVNRVIQPNDENTDLVLIQVNDHQGRFEQQSFLKPTGKFWDFECARNERMAIKLLIHNLLMK